MPSFEISVSIDNAVLASILNEHATTINQDYYPYCNFSEIKTTITDNRAEMFQNGLERDIDPHTPSSLQSLVYVLIKFLDIDGKGAADDLYGQIEDKGIDRINLDISKYGAIGQLYKDLCINEESIINHMNSVTWSSKVEDWEEEFFEETTQFSYDPQNGENYIHELD